MSSVSFGKRFCQGQILKAPRRGKASSPLKGLHQNPKEKASKREKNQRRMKKKDRNSNEGAWGLVRKGIVGLESAQRGWGEKTGWEAGR